jgi:hypothetical protein
VIENDNNKLASYRFLKEKTEEKKKKKTLSTAYGQMCVARGGDPWLVVLLWRANIPTKL